MIERAAISKENEAREVYSKVVRAGRRTYFFDVKATRGGDYFLTITESRKLDGDNGAVYYEKHKIHLYKEDFMKYSEGLNDVMDFVKRKKPQFFSNNGCGINVENKRPYEDNDPETIKQ